ncbi:uncharacterized protein LOC132699330 [Cylas formicarius]|uniref:uncharacterized protein LOC132699330 n=1 Tax=Cylas formicarius TaxID=197179 RepID=UPI00295883A0|nr:uncharacterized protein LOC132699330 [Cylas formicarius]
MLSGLLLVVFLPSLVYSLQCYRCFGNSFCNDFNSANATSLAHIDNCNQGLASYDGDDIHIKRLTNAVSKLISNSPSIRDSSLPGCLTATVHEARYDHTIRLCVTNASIICQAIQEVLFPVYHDYDAVGFSCAGCTSDLCNSQTQRSTGNITYFSLSLLVVLSALKLIT